MNSSTFDLEDKVAIVTGAASGIGAAVAQRFAKSGARVALVDVNHDGANKVLGELPGIDLHRAFAFDLADRSQCERVVPEVIDWAGRVDILVNSAAYLERKPIADVDADFWDRTVAINMACPFLLCRACIEPMRRQGNGRIILLSSQGAFTGGLHGSTVYAMTKAGVVALMKSLARKLASDDITVNAIAPGGVDTAMLHGGMRAADVESFVRTIPLGRLATPEEIAGACEFLASDEAAYITGHTLDVNGGQLMR